MLRPIEQPLVLLAVVVVAARSVQFTTIMQSWQAVAVGLEEAVTVPVVAVVVAAVDRIVAVAVESIRRSDWMNQK